MSYNILNLVVADFDENLVTSTQEIAQYREQQEAMQLEAIELQTSTLLARAAEIEQNLIEEERVLREERDQCRHESRLVQRAIKQTEEELRQDILRNLDIRNEIAQFHRASLGLQANIQQLKEENDGRVATDPITALLEEEKYLKQQILEIERDRFDRFDGASSSKLS